MPAAVDDILRRLEEMRTARSSMESHWRSCYDVTFPLRGSGFNGETRDQQSSADRRADLLDSTGTDAARTQVAGILGGMTPVASQWAAGDVDGADQDGDVWLEQAFETLWKLIHSSNYDAAAYDAITDLVAAGWGVLYIDESPDGLVFEAWPIAQCYVSTSKPGQPVDIVFREWEMTAQQATEEFGDALSPAVAKLIADKKPEAPVRFVRAIYPRREYVSGSVMAANLPIASCTIEVAAKHLVRESGYHEMPVIVPRWSKLPMSEYATGPTSDALPDLRMLQRLKFNQLASTEIAVGGMYKAVDDGVLNAATVTIGPRKIIVMNDINSMAPLETGSDFNVSFTTEERLQAQVRRIFMADALAPADGPQMTATEIHVRVALIRQLLGPTYGRLLADWLRQQVTRCFGLAFRAGALGQPPESLAGRAWTVRYLNPLSLAQSLEQVTAMDRFETTLIAEAQASPDVLDTYDWDEAARYRSNKLGVPKSLMRDPKLVAQMRAQRQQAEQRQQAHEGVQGALEDADPAARLGGLISTEAMMN